MPAKQAKADRILRRRQVLERTGLSDTTLWRYERDGKFPKRRVLTDSGLVGWRESEVTAWIADRLRGGGRAPKIESAARGGGRRQKRVETAPGPSGEGEVMAWIVDLLGRALKIEPAGRGGGRVETVPDPAPPTVMLELPSARSIFPDLPETEVILGYFGNGGIVTFKPTRRQVRGASDNR